MYLFMYQWLRIALIAMPLLFAGANRNWSAGQETPSQKTVVVELFTSEGCSSCPPADELLSRISQQKTLSGAQVIPLGFHVDYWNYLGWRDRFSSSQYSLRQQQYAAKFGLGGPYTPQMVVQGSEEFVGGDQQRARQAIANAAAQSSQATVELSATGDKLQVAVHSNSGLSANVILAITEDGLETHVGGGENGGRVLRHSAVVRGFRRIGQLSNGSFEAVVPVNPQSGWSLQNLHAAVIIQNISSYKIEGAASIALPRS